jgi:hypothetical protein
MRFGFLLRFDLAHNLVTNVRPQRIKVGRKLAHGCEDRNNDERNHESVFDCSCAAIIAHYAT